jgi:hypothetical protein
MHGVFLPSGLWLNLAQLTGIDFEAGLAILTAPGVRRGAAETGDAGPAYLELPEGDLNALWDYLLGVSVSLGEHSQRDGWQQPEAGNVSMPPVQPTEVRP